MGIETGILQYPSAEWGNRDDFIKGRLIASHLKVTNDHAERAVRLMLDYNTNVTKREGSYQQVLLNTAELRKDLADKKKSSLVSKYENS